MTEHFTEAFVISKEPLKENDALIRFYTQKLGRITAKATGARRILSKLNPHTEPLSLTLIRLINGKNGFFQLVDAIRTYSPVSRKNPDCALTALGITNILLEETFEKQPDASLWYAIKSSLLTCADEKETNRRIIKSMGFFDGNASCFACGKKPPVFFKLHDHEFLCSACATASGSKGNKSMVALS